MYLTNSSPIAILFLRGLLFLAAMGNWTPAGAGIWQPFLFVHRLILHLALAKLLLPLLLEKRLL